MKKLIVLSCLFLSGCGIFTKEVEKPIVVDIPKSEQFHPPVPKMQLIENEPWVVLPKGTVTPDTVYAMTPKAYETNAYNMAEIKRYIQSLKDLIAYYRKPPKPLTPAQPTQ